MLDQLEFANVVIVSKASIFLERHAANENSPDDAGEKGLRTIERLLHKLNPKARIVIPRADKYGDMDVAKELLNTELFNMEEASRSAGTHHSS